MTYISVEQERVPFLRWPEGTNVDLPGEVLDPFAHPRPATCRWGFFQPGAIGAWVHYSLTAMERREL